MTSQGIRFDVVLLACGSIAIACLGIGFLLGFALGLVV